MLAESILKTGFDSVSQRFIHTLVFNFSEFKFVESATVPETAQRAFYDLLVKIILTLYNDPAILKLPLDQDDVLDTCSVYKPELKKTIVKIRNEVAMFYAFLLHTGYNGEINETSLTVDTERLPSIKVKGPYLSADLKAKKPFYTLLNAVGFHCAETGRQITISCDNAGMLQAWKLLSQRCLHRQSPEYHFAFALFDDNMSWWLRRVENAAGLPPSFFDFYEKSYLKKGYVKSIDLSGGRIRYELKGKISGFKFQYEPMTRSDAVEFSTLNGIGFKAMLADFDLLDESVKELAFKTAARCNYCGGCTKGADIDTFTVNVSYKGEEYAICPQFPQLSWSTDFNRDVMDAIVKFNGLQEKYGRQWKMPK